MTDAARTPTRIAIVEDDRKLGPLLVKVLTFAKYEATLLATAEAARAHAREPFDLAIVDWMLPDGDGLEVCAHLRRERYEGPILMLTARGETRDRVRALDLAADDYLTKPFEMDELLARMRALSRRSARPIAYDAGPLHIDVARRYVFAGGTLLTLTGREFDLLAYLARFRDTPVSKSELVDTVWDASEIVGGVVEVYVSRVREKLGRHAWALETVRGVGYRLRSEPPA